ncbi:MAG: hypothetical protein ACRYG5_01315 [Janthinobacterium lividum]
MTYQRSPARPPSDRHAEYALADKARAEKRALNDTQLDNGAIKWRYKPTDVGEVKRKINSSTP